MRSGGFDDEFVPGRNLFFFAFAATVADRRGLDVLVGGMGETELSSYPDARDNALKAMQIALSLGLDSALTIETPLMWRDKAGTWAWPRISAATPLSTSWSSTLAPATWARAASSTAGAMAAVSVRRAISGARATRAGW
jgi:7-cyano-7-deazaguanine synthase in queuosine biosynthesis